MASVEPELKLPPLLSHEPQLQSLQNTPISQDDRGTWMFQILESITSLSCRAKSFNNVVPVKRFFSITSQMRGKDILYSC